MSGGNGPFARSAEGIDALIAELEQCALAYRNKKSAPEQSVAYMRWFKALGELGRLRRERAKASADAVKSAGV